MSEIIRDNAAELGFFASLRKNVVDTVVLWNKRVEARRELAELSFRDIQDIGLDQAEIDREIAKPFWRE